jgi:hypothetical protein
LTAFFVVFSREESKSHDEFSEGKEAVADWVARNVVIIACLIVFNRKNIF